MSKRPDLDTNQIATISLIIPPQSIKMKSLYISFKFSYQIQPGEKPGLVGKKIKSNLHELIKGYLCATVVIHIDDLVNIMVPRLVLCQNELQETIGNRKH